MRIPKSKFLVIGALLVFAFTFVLVVLAASPVTDTFTDETKIAASTNITVSGGQVKLSWVCGDTVAYDGGPYDANGTSQTTGGYYRTVLIGTQCWFKDNLNVGTAIGSKLADNATVQNQSDNSLIEKYCNSYVQQDNAGQIVSGIADCVVYGGLYQWPETVQYSNGVTLTTGTDVASGNIQGICPVGWHIPSDTEFTTLITYLGDNSGGKMKEAGLTHWITPNTAADNSSGFTGLGAGYCTDGSFSLRGYRAHFWSTLPYLGAGDITTSGYYRRMIYTSTVTSKTSGSRTQGNSVRCLKD